MGSFLGNKKKRAVPRQPPGYPQRRAPPPQIVEVKRRFAAMKSKALIYAVLGSALSAAAGFALYAALPGQPGLSLGAAAALAVLFTYLAVNQALNAYSYYLFMRLKMEFSSLQTVEKLPAAPQPLPPVRQPPAATVGQTPVARPIVNVEAPPIAQARPKPAPKPLASAPAAPERPATPPVTAEQPQEPIIEIKEAASPLQQPPVVEAPSPQPPVKPASPALQRRAEAAPKPAAAPPLAPSQPAPPQSTQPSGGKKVCPYCGRELPYGDLHVICPYCGRRLK